MPNTFKTNALTLTKQVVTATGNSLYVNGVGASDLVSGNLTTTGAALGASIGALSGWARSVERLCISFNSPGSTTWASMNGPQEFFNRATGNATFVDLTPYTGVMLVANKLATTGANFSSVYLGYNGAFQTTPGNYLSLETVPLRLSTCVQNVVIQSGWRTLAPAARSGVYVALLGSGGVLAISPIFGRVDAYFM